MPFLAAAGGIVLLAQCIALIGMTVHGGIVGALSDERGLTSALVNMSAVAAAAEAGAEAGAETEPQAVGNCSGVFSGFYVVDSKVHVRKFLESVSCLSMCMALVLPCYEDVSFSGCFQRPLMIVRHGRSPCLGFSLWLRDP